MACLAFGRAALLSHPSFGDRQLEELELSVADDPRVIAQEAAVFDAMAQQVTAFICNVDEATVNCGASEPHSIAINSGSGSAASTASGGTATGSSSPSSGGGGGGASTGGAKSSAEAVANSSGGGSSRGSSCSPGSLPGLFRRLRAAHSQTGFGWRDTRAAFEQAVRRENRVERMVARSDPVAAEKRLQHRLLVARLEATSFKGCSAGNSLFDALSLALWGTVAFGPAVRAVAVAYAARHPAEFRCFLGDDWPAYLGGMSRLGTPGDELMLRAVSDHFGVPINIATSDAFMWFQRYSPIRTRSQREVTLAFLGPNTWMPVRRQSTMTTLRLNLLGSSEWRQAREMRRKMSQFDTLQPGTPPGPAR